MNDIILKTLLEHKDTTYKAFQEKLITSKYPIIGVRIPILKKIAKEMRKTKDYQFIHTLPHHSFEEVMIHGLILGYIKEPLSTILSYLDSFLPYIDNWAINDTVSANIKRFKVEQELGYAWIEKSLKSNNPWQIRFALTLLLSHYINETYLFSIYQKLETIKIKDYYVHMAMAWIISICYIKYPKETKQFLKNAKIDTWTYNKAIQKIIESKRISKEEKNKLRNMKK